jgi:hypothetical protein
MRTHATDYIPNDPVLAYREGLGWTRATIHTTRVNTTINPGTNQVVQDIRFLCLPYPEQTASPAILVDLPAHIKLDPNRPVPVFNRLYRQEITPKKAIEQLRGTGHVVAMLNDKDVFGWSITWWPADKPEQAQKAHYQVATAEHALMQFLNSQQLQ